jgi:hypothetical protein
MPMSIAIDNRRYAERGFYMNTRSFISLAWAIAAIGGTAASNAQAADNGKAPDVFEQIAQQKNATVPGLAGNPASKLEIKALPWDAQPGTGFTPAAKMTTQAQLDAELRRWRERYAPFMADIAPTMASPRRQLELKTFNWRLETPADQADFANVLEGRGDWKPVAIPHYGGPINQATAYYRTEVTLDEAMAAAPALFIHFQAVDYLADVYVNGKLAGSHEGIFNAFEFDIKPLIVPGKNVIVVKVRNDAVMMGDFMFPGKGRQFGKKIAACGGPGWDDPNLGWIMCPPGFGIWQRAWLESRPAAYVRELCVRPRLAEAKAEVSVEVPATAKNIVLRWSLYGQNFLATIAEHQVPADLTEIAAAADHPGFVQLKFTIPIPREKLKIWSPATPWLYQLQIELGHNGQIVDTAKRQFGMRSFVQSATSTPKGRFYLNGEEIKLRGANMMGNLMQCVVRKDFDQLRDDILLAKIANLNFWRMTQQPCPEEAYDYFDRLGFLAQTDLPVFNGIRKDQAEESLRQLQAMVRLVRSHPCNSVITYCNEPDFNKPMMLNRQGHIDLFKRFDAAAQELNPDQVIKWIDGDYVNLNPGFSDHHCYNGWYKGHGIGAGAFYKGAWMATREGWMHGCGEFGAEALDSVELMQKRYPAKWLETKPDGSWDPNVIPYCQTRKAGTPWIPPQKTMEQWVNLTREHQKCVIRLMAETFRRDPKLNSMAVHLLIDAWPAGWMKSLMDCDRQAKPAYFAYREALTPLAVNLRPAAFYCFSGDALSLPGWICNDTSAVPAGAVLRYQIELGGKILRTGSAPATVLASAPQYQGSLEFVAPAVETRQPLTIRFGLFGADGTLLHDTSIDLDLFPATDKGKKLDRPGGQSQLYINS